MTDMLNVTVLGAPELTARFNRVLARLENLEPEFRQIGEHLTQFFSTAPFLSRGGVYGSPWADLSPAYKLRKERLFPGKGTLVASGKMMDSFKANVEPFRVTIVNDSHVFEYHQMGTDKMPQRVMMQLDQSRVTNVLGIAKKSLDLRISEAWI